MLDRSSRVQASDETTAACLKRTRSDPIPQENCNDASQLCSVRGVDLGGHRGASPRCQHSALYLARSLGATRVF